MEEFATLEELKADYSRCMKLDLSKLQCEETSIDDLGSLVDSSFYLKKEEGFLKAIELFEHLKSLDIPKKQYTRLFYYGGNAYYELDSFRNNGQDSSWIWDRELVEKTIISYRLSLKEKYLQYADKELRRKILVNLGNMFSHLGRIVEAHNYWAKGLKMSPDFPMALCNKGMGFFEYAKILYDKSHKEIFLKLAFKLMSAGVENLDDQFALNHFQSLITQISSVFSIDYLTSDFNFKEFSLGKSKKEIEYRKWCLRNCLFLNPLNEIGEFSIFAHDILSTPPMLVKTSDNMCPKIHGLVNQIKMEFINARYLIYLGLNELGEKFVNKGTHLIDTLDYPEYGINLEYIRASYRIAYSILDKIAFAMDDYYELNMKKTSISLKSVWGTYDKKQKRLFIRPEFENRKNWALRGLYWLSKDLFESGMFRDAIEPEAREIAQIRNHLEHKYLKIHYMLAEEFYSSQKDSFKYSFQDTLSYSVKRGDFEDKALKLLKMVREAIIYFLLSIHINEEQSKQIEKKDVLIGNISLNEYKFY